MGTTYKQLEFGHFEEERQLKKTRVERKREEKEIRTGIYTLKRRISNTEPGRINVGRIKVESQGNQCDDSKKKFSFKSNRKFAFPLSCFMYASNKNV